MEEVINPLKIAFADTYAFYVKAQNYQVITKNNQRSELIER